MDYSKLTDSERVMVDTFTKPLHIEIEGYRRALEFIRKMEWDAGCSGDGIYAAADAALSRQSCTRTSDDPPCGNVECGYCRGVSSKSNQGSDDAP